MPKEKKDAQALKELKAKAVNQHLGEEAILQKSSAEIFDELYRKGEEDMIKKAGGKNKWKKLSPTIKAEKQALMGRMWMP